MAGTVSSTPSPCPLRPPAPALGTLGRIGTPSTTTEHVSDVTPATETPPVRCASCEAELTTPARAIARGGSHEHTFRNPAGYSWTLACYRDAPGCASSGTPTAEASWFAGHSWCFAECGTCGRHLGWWFIGSSGSFAGLIVTRLAR